MTDENARSRYDAENPPVGFRLPRESLEAIDGARDLYPNADNGQPSRSSVLRAMVAVALPVVTDRDLMHALDAARGSSSRGAYLLATVRNALGVK